MTRWLTEIRARFKALTRALISMKPFGLWLAGLVVAFMFGGVYADGPEQRANHAGNFLQLLGVAQVAYGIDRTRRQFGGQGVLASVKDWALRAAKDLFGRRESRTAAVTATVGSLSFAGEVVAVLIAAPGSSLDHRVEVLEQRVNSIDTRINSIADGLRKDLGVLREELRRERMERQRVLGQVEARVADLAVGGLELEIVGLGWVLVGIVLTGWPSVLAVWSS